MLLTVDVIVCSDDGNRILLIKRAKPPFQDKLVFPGGHVEETDTTTKYAAVRELLEEVSLDVNPYRLQLFNVLDEIDRDPRDGRRISIVYLVLLPEQQLEQGKAGSDASSISILEVDKLQEEDIGFDHGTLLPQLKAFLSGYKRGLRGECL